MPIQSKTPGYLVIPPATASKTGYFRVVAPCIQFIGRAVSIEMAEAIIDLHVQVRS